MKTQPTRRGNYEQPVYRFSWCCDGSLLIFWQKSASLCELVVQLSGSFELGQSTAYRAKPDQSKHNTNMSKYQTDTIESTSIWYNIADVLLLVVECILSCSSGDLLSVDLWLYRSSPWLGRIGSFQFVTVTTHPTASHWRWTFSAARTRIPILLSSIVLFWGHLVQRWPR